MKKTVIIGASTQRNRYAYQAAESLQAAEHEFIPLGIREGKVLGEEIITEKPLLEDVDTVTLYISPKHQDKWYDYILGLAPKRIIFNPGTENTEFARRAEAQGIEALYACTLVMLSTGQY